VTKPVDKDSLPLDKPRRTPGHPTKSHVVKTKVDGREKIIRFGEQGAETAGKPKAGESDRMKAKRASFKARHAQNIAKGKSSPAYWANKVKWNEGGMVKMAAGGGVRLPRAEGAALQLIEQMRRAGGQEEFNPVLASTREQRARPAGRPQAAPQMAPQAVAPLTAMQAPQTREEALPLPPTPPAMRPDENPPPEAPRNPMQFDEGNPHVATAISMAQRYNLPPSIFLSLVQQESRFNPEAVSPRGAIGLGQLMPATARELGVDPRDPVQNLEGSARYLRQQIDRFGDMSLALAAYNAGPGAVRRAGNTIPNNRETRNYVPSILRRAGVQQGEFAEGGLADLDQKYAGGGRVRRTLRDELRDIEAEIRGERPASIGVTVARGIGEGGGGIAGVTRRVGRAATMTPDEAMLIATARQPGAGVPRLEGEDLERANELSQRVLDFRASQMRLPPSQRIQARPEDQIFAPARFDRPLEAGPTSAAQDLEALRIENISPRQQLPGSRAGAGVATDLAENYGSTLDRIVEELGPVARLMRGEDLPDATAAQIAAARSGEFYNMRPVYDVLRAEGVPHDEAIRRIRQESQAIAGTSPRTDTEQNVLNSAFLQNRMARGLPVDAASVQAATGPGSGYGMIYDQHPALTQGLLEGTISLAQNPKPSIFARNISGDRSAVTADVHNVRAVNMLYNDVNPGGLPASSFDTANNYRRYREAYLPDADGNVRGMNDAELREILVARPSGQGIRGQDVSTEYPIYNDITTRVGERLGLTPADTQALMWFHYGPRTGLASEAHTVPELLNQRMSITAQGLGMSPEEVMRLYSRNMIPLAGAAPAAVLLSDGESPASLEDLDQKYAEGGEVRTPEEDEYDRRLLSRMKAQTGRVTEPTRAEQMQALRTAGREAAEGVADVLLPQSPLDFALMAAMGPGGRAVRLAGSAALASLEPSEAEASRFRRLIRAYHGSPHRFDEFDIRKIGTGEGAQAYGRGLYFAEDEDVAKYYRDKLRGTKLGAMENAMADLPENLRQRALSSMYYNNISPEDTADMLSLTRAGSAVGRDDLSDILRRAAVAEPPPGHMYEVDLNAAPRDFLNWDAPLSQQSRGVQESLQRFGLRADPDAARAYDDALLDALYNDPGRALPPQPRDPTGEDIYKRVLRMDPEEARVALMQAGIPGTRYLDAGSRGVGGTYNYAVFDPEIIDITRRYAEGGLAHLDQKYAEGGIVGAEAAKYNPDAVDALVKQIEAEYV
jgi:soluble lytic murein transglycosylase-like protein